MVLNFYAAMATLWAKEEVPDSTFHINCTVKCDEKDSIFLFEVESGSIYRNPALKGRNLMNSKISDAMDVETADAGMLGSEMKTLSECNKPIFQRVLKEYQRLILKTGKENSLFPNGAPSNFDDYIKNLKITEEDQSSVEFTIPTAKLNTHTLFRMMVVDEHSPISVILVFENKEADKEEEITRYFNTGDRYLKITHNNDVTLKKVFATRSIKENQKTLDMPLKLTTELARRTFEGAVGIKVFPIAQWIMTLMGLLIMSIIALAVTATIWHGRKEKKDFKHKLTMMRK